MYAAGTYMYYVCIYNILLRSSTLCVELHRNVYYSFTNVFMSVYKRMFLMFMFNTFFKLIKIFTFAQSQQRRNHMYI